MRRQTNDSAQGFTLIETMIVASVISVLTLLIVQALADLEDITPLDAPMAAARAGRLSRRLAVELFESQLTSRLLDFEAREMKARGEVSDDGRIQALAGVDYFLEGEVRALSASTNKNQTDYVVIRFQLTDAETGIVGWSNSYEMKKEGKWGVMYQ